MNRYFQVQVSVKEDLIAKKPIVVVDAGVHAREWATIPVALYLIQELVENRAKHPQMVELLDWYIIPMVNPDGYEYSMEEGNRLWRKNRAPCINCDKRNKCGVDLNRNFDFQWNRKFVFFILKISLL